MEKEKLRQCLTDTGCSKDTADHILKSYESGNTEDMIRLMKKERCRIMDDYHECGRKIDCMDFMLRKIENEVNRR